MLGREVRHGHNATDIYSPTLEHILAWLTWEAAFKTCPGPYRSPLAMAGGKALSVVVDPAEEVDGGKALNRNKGSDFDILPALKDEDSKGNG